LRGRRGGQRQEEREQGGSHHGAAELAPSHCEGQQIEDRLARGGSSHVLSFLFVEDKKQRSKGRMGRHSGSWLTAGRSTTEKNLLPHLAIALIGGGSVEVTAASFPVARKH
jgi:hypothetical protein